MKPKHKVILIIADGWGYAKPGPGNYVSMAKTPVTDMLLKTCPHTLNDASGNAVGLPAGSQGNSEVGHLHMGAGRIVWQMYEKINQEVKNKKFYTNPRLLAVIDAVKKKGSALHLMGLCSDEGVHAHTDHLLALLEMAEKRKIGKVFIHFFADGRDVAEKSALKYVQMIEAKKIGRIATVCGRYYSMDRDKNWERTEKAYELLTEGKGFTAKSASEAVELAYKRGDKTDYYIQPTVITDTQGKPVGLIQDDDGIIFFNFRTDRPRQLTEAFVSKKFIHFTRKKAPKVTFGVMTPYYKGLEKMAAYSEEKIKNNLGSVVAHAGWKQLRLAETEKYAHVTYFFNSQIEKPFKGEERVLIPSAKVPSYDQKPEMSAAEIADEAVKRITLGKYGFIVINFANCDLVGHSAVKEAIIKAVEVSDACLGKVTSAAVESGYTVLITGDHGSAEDKLYADGKPKPSHSTNPVHFILVSPDKQLEKAKLKPGGQSDVAPTILDLLGLKQPKEMTGKSLIIK